MCRHCERIKEHPEDKPIVHAFMERTAQRLSELRNRPVTADDLTVNVTITVTRPAWAFVDEMHK